MNALLLLALTAFAGVVKAPASALPTPVVRAAIPALPPSLTGATPLKLSPVQLAGVPTLTPSLTPSLTPAGLTASLSPMLEAQVQDPGSAQVAAQLGTVFDGSVPKVAAVSADVYPVRSLDSIQELKMGTYNVLNLFEMVGKWVKGVKVADKKLKADWQLRESAKAILESDLDVVALQEVENVAALEQFNERFLGGKYRVLLIEGNDERGIDVGFLVKKDLPFEIEHRTNKDELWTDPVDKQEKKLFSRDLPVLVFRAQGRAQPLFVFVGTHFKSKRDRDGDPQSEIMRTAQADRAAEILGRLRAEFGEDAPLMLAGDFNGDVQRDASFDRLRGAGMTDALDVAGVPDADRVTHTYHPRGGATDKKQMDGFFLSKKLQALLGMARVYRYLDAQGRVKPIPDTYDQRSQNPSDHFPLLVTLRFQELLKSWREKAQAQGARAP